MKRTLTLTAILLLAATVLCACGVQPYSELTQDMTNAPDPALVGFWSDPVQTSTSMDDVWEYRADGTLYLHQIDKDGVIKKSIDGTYRVEGAKLITVISGYTLPYDGYEIVSDTLLLSDHGVESAFPKYTKTVYK